MFPHKKISTFSKSNKNLSQYHRISFFGGPVLTMYKTAKSWLPMQCVQCILIRGCDVNTLALLHMCPHHSHTTKQKQLTQCTLYSRYRTYVVRLCLQCIDSNDQRIGYRQQTKTYMQKNKFK